MVRNFIRASIFFICLLSFSKALVLEEMADLSVLEGKKIGYYVGSFDPIHKGHQYVAQTVPCDYVLIYPAWGGDSYKKRTDIKERIKMVFALFQDDPRVIVTKLPPQDLQKRLNKPDYHFVGIVGSDTALNIAPNDEALQAFMTGKEVTEKHYNHTVGGLMALSVASFIVVIREGDDLAPLHGKIGQRPIEQVIDDSPYKDVSSTRVRNAIQANESIKDMVGEELENLIGERNLYQN